MPGGENRCSLGVKHHSAKPPLSSWPLFCVDEKTAIQALDRKDRMLPLAPGRAESHGFEYKRNGTLSLFAALNCNISGDERAQAVPIGFPYPASPTECWSALAGRPTLTHASRPPLSATVRQRHKESS